MRARCASDTIFGFEIRIELLFVEDFVGDIGFVCVVGVGVVTNSTAVSSSMGKSLHSCPTFSFQKPMTVLKTRQMHALSRWRRKQFLFSMKNRQQFGGGV